MPTRKDVLITDYADPSLLKGLISRGFRPTYAPEMSRKEMEGILSNYSGVVINTRCAINRTAMDSAPSLKWIARLGSGLDIIDLDAAAEKSIHVISAPEGNAQAVAEHAFGMLLCLSNKLLSADAEVRDGLWLREKNRGWEISGKTIGIIGYGNNGSAFGKLWRGWDVNIIAYDKYLSQYGDDKVKAVELDFLLSSADIISFHVPLMDETFEMVNAAFLNRCKKGCVIINTSRGKVIELNALVDALQSFHVKGACLDVLPFEPPASGTESFQNVFDALCKLDNVVLSPHVAGWTIESKKRIADVLLKKIGQEVLQS